MPSSKLLNLQMVGISLGSVGRIYYSISSNICSAGSWQHQRWNCRTFHYLCTSGISPYVLFRKTFRCCILNKICGYKQILDCFL